MREDLSPIASLATARSLLLKREVEPAGRIFLSLKDHPRWGYLAHYGVGLCFLELSAHSQAIEAFEKAFALEKKPFIAIAILETLAKLRQFETLASRTLKMASEFSESDSVVRRLRKIYEISLRNDREEPPHV